MLEYYLFCDHNSWLFGGTGGKRTGNGEERKGTREGTIEGRKQTERGKRERNRDMGFVGRH